MEGEGEGSPQPLIPSISRPAEVSGTNGIAAIAYASVATSKDDSGPGHKKKNHEGSGDTSNDEWQVNQSIVVVD